MAIGLGLMFGFQFLENPAIDVDDIAQSLEGEEGNADGQNKFGLLENRFRASCGRVDAYIRKIKCDLQEGLCPYNKEPYRSWFQS